MLSERQLADLLSLLRARYPDWEACTHPPFEADEIAYKRAAVAQAAEWLSQSELDRLIAANDYTTFLERLEKLANATNLLWRRAPSAGDTAVLHHPDLDPARFCTQVRNLLYGDRPTPERLQSFADLLTARNWPNKWPFPTYYLFLCHPETEMFVKPQAAHWFLQFMGAAETAVASPPTAAIYRAIHDAAQALREALAPYDARDMVDVQSFVWVCFRESQARTGQLDAKGQVELDVPPTEPQENVQAAPAATPAMLREGAGAHAYRATTRAPVYGLDAMEAEIGYTKETLARWLRAVARKGQAIFYGPPGTGKTFVAQKLAAHLVGGADGFWELIQFHPAYAYEEFMQGIRPLTQPDGSLSYGLVDGRFKQFCARARQREGPCVLIIDEINRADIAGVFGELMYLLEYRDAEIPLAGGGRFSIPPNVRMLATMNTADRAIALVDHALRRRFAFIHLPPSEAVLRRFHAPSDFPVEKLIALLRRLNRQIGDPHYYVGHSFFLHPDLATQLADIWRMEIEPYLEEYFFDQPTRLDEFRWEQIRSELGLD